VAQLNDGMINAQCFAGMMLRYHGWWAVFSIDDFMIWRVGKGVNSQNPITETYPFTEKVIIL
jgi:hypothetical protein